MDRGKPRYAIISFSMLILTIFTGIAFGKAPSVSASIEASIAESMRQQQDQMWLDSNQQEMKEEEIKQQNIEKFLKLGKDGYMQDCLVSFPAAIEAANAVSPGEDLKVNLTEINEMCDKDTTLVESYTNKSSSSPQENQTLN